jgi:sialidase-1
MKIRINAAFIILIIGNIICQICDGQPYVVNALWTSPDRIPVLSVAPNGGLLAFACQRAAASDSGYNNVTLRRSLNNGTNWTLLRIVAGDGTNTYGVGGVVVDHTNNNVFFITAWNLATDTEQTIDNHTSTDTVRVFICSSTDSGTNWSGPTQITSMVKKTNWDFCAIGPGNGIQLSTGRLIVPWYYSILTNYYPSVIYSDDHGITWTSSIGATNNMPGYNECNVVALTNGNLMMIARNNTGIGTTMGISISTDAGVTWSATTNSATLNDSGCEASFIRYTAPPQYGKTRLLFANPNSAIPGNRANGTVRVSYDEGQTWTISKVYYPNLFGYSALTILPNGNWALLAENGTSSYYDQISLLSDTLSNLTGGADSLDPIVGQSRPTLSLISSGSNLLFTWPASATNFSLQSSLTGNGWTNTAGTGSESVSNGQNQLNLPRTGSGFFRLMRL